MTASLASLAASMGLSPVEAIALPTVVEVAARKSGIAESEIAFRAHHNAPLRDYLASICRKAEVLEAAR